jgi:hypothetical protein
MLDPRCHPAGIFAVASNILILDIHFYHVLLGFVSTETAHRPVSTGHGTPCPYITTSFVSYGHFIVCFIWAFHFLFHLGAFHFLFHLGDPAGRPYI